MKNEERGFFSIDALFALTLLLMISASFLNIYEGRKNSTELMNDRLEARLIGEKLAAAINNTYAAGPGFELLVELPENAGSRPYRITLDNAERQIYVENSAWGNFGFGVVSGNVKNFVLGPENLRSAVRVRWEENQVRVGS